jgi:NAD(P)-dependent dehydrogenase (short-subunit alcohol dehydrogenase family)
LRDGVTSEALQAIVDLDLDDLLAIGPPRGSAEAAPAAKAGIAHYTRYPAQDLVPFGVTANCVAPGVIATGRIMATVIPGSSQSNRDRAELVAFGDKGRSRIASRWSSFWRPTCPTM